MADEPDTRHAHLDRLVRTWLGLRSDAPAPPLPEPLARRLLRDEERERTGRDQWGNWEFGLCEAFLDGELWEPTVDRWLATQTAGEPRWPGNARFAVCFTHDVDIVAAGYSPRQALRLIRARATATPGHGRDVMPRIVRAAGASSALIWQRGGRAPDAGPLLERCVEVERASGVRGSYFIPVHAGRASNPYDICAYSLDDRCTWSGRETTVATVLRELADEGFDIGLHGSYASATDGALLREERERLATALGREVTTSRQHWLHWTIDRTPVVQQEAGLRADSTLGFNRNVGFRAGTSLPFRWWDANSAQALDLIQLPLVVQEAALTEVNALELDGAGAIAVWDAMVTRAAETGGVATLLVHPHALADPRVSGLYHRAVVEAVQAGAWVATLAQIDAHWREREQRLGLAP